MARGVCVALVLLCCVVARARATTPTSPCSSHRNVINGVATSETDSSVTEGDVHIVGCGNVVRGNVLPSSDMVVVLGSDNVVRGAGRRGDCLLACVRACVRARARDAGLHAARSALSAAPRRMAG